MCFEPKLTNNFNYLAYRFLSILPHFHLYKTKPRWPPSHPNILHWSILPKSILKIIPAQRIVLFSGSKKHLNSRAYRCIERQSHLFASSCRPPTYILQSRFQPCITLLPSPDITSSSLQCPSFQLACLIYNLVNPAPFPSSISQVKQTSHLHHGSPNIFVT